jgi:hypothetical protein
MDSGEVAYLSDKKTRLPLPPNAFLFVGEIPLRLLKRILDHAEVRFTARLQDCNTAEPQFVQSSFSQFFRDLLT